MHDQFDKKLTERIKYVFDTYEDDSYELSWEELLKKFPEKKKQNTFVLWISSAAAIFLLAFGLWFFIHSQPGEQTTVKATSSQPSSLKSMKEPVHQREEGLQAEALGSDHSNNTPAQLLTSAHVSKSTFTARKAARLSALEVPSAEVKEDSPENNILAATPTASQAGNQLKTDSSASDPSLYVRQAEKDSQKKEVGRDDLIKSQAEALANIKDLSPVKKEDKKNNKRLSVAVFAGSFLNYSEGSKTSVNTGVGLVSEIGITKKLKIGTGVSLAQNTLKYGSAAPKDLVMALEPSFSDGGSTRLATTFTSSVSPSPSMREGYDASLLGLDIPLNLKYTFIDNKKELYMVAGLSSNFFIDESYTFNYSRMTLDNGISNEKATTKTSSFDFARMLNVSVGFGYPIGRQNKLSFEPFLKYPLGGLGSQNLHFGAAGLNLKFNFSTN